MATTIQEIEQIDAIECLESGAIQVKKGTYYEKTVTETVPVMGTIEVRTPGLDENGDPVTRAEPVMTEDVNFQLRLQTAQQIVQQSSAIQEKMQSQPLVQQLAENRLKYLQFGIQQQQNAQIGRTGVAPVAQQQQGGGMPPPQGGQPSPEPQQAQPVQAGGGGY